MFSWYWIATETVHPRVGGEHSSARAARPINPGSSPRGRGTRLPCLCSPMSLRFIPAWAGNTPPLHRISHQTPVHPRVGGEHRRRLPVAGSEAGSSPRGRGTPIRYGSRIKRRRFIPAWAGNTVIPIHQNMLYSVHPRVGGEHQPPAPRKCDQHGSSPRGRGTQPPPLGVPRLARFIPAWAGNTNIGLHHGESGTVHPRVGGEHGIRPLRSRD